ncbi:MAG: hypothetical protein AAF392_01670, partial [Bacteroidota bacterium]
MHQWKNKYYKRSHIAEAECRQLIKGCPSVLNAFDPHKIIHISPHSPKVFYAKIHLHSTKFFVDDK